MIETSPSGGVDLFDVHRIRLEETEAPPLSPKDRQAVDQAWDEAVRANPALFDGPAVACVGTEWEGPHDLLLRWARVTYRHYALGRFPVLTAWSPSLFVNVVQPTDDGRVLAVRMSPSTAAPGRWQLPGGSAEPPEPHRTLDEAALRRHAALELVEETGIDVRPEDLRLWVVTRGEDRSVGLMFLAPPKPERVIRERFEAMTAAEQAQDRLPELDQTALVSSPADLSLLAGPHVDYLEPIVHRSTRLLKDGATSARPPQNQPVPRCRVVGEDGRATPG
ncbi:NUDIX hydrolase [Streptosporangium saharense]|uniref:8-oxo-dGTP pyrophosphatase MutT (NUDIX family) n=1 Tax=Streptosporangium saharense TaxID=1706840 RepID=A0A7W7QQR1_9ACTN|nr:NUDIX hydrolase [Streptosporangium saharense]MBB4918055.1 8-oxo-dGTP pyrophosphatase MutT (NUDIX family) [Streptosporangium saharense]